VSFVYITKLSTEPVPLLNLIVRALNAKKFFYQRLACLIDKPMGDEVLRKVRKPNSIWFII
jgi:hypothetical protein